MKHVNIDEAGVNSEPFIILDPRPLNARAPYIESAGCLKAISKGDSVERVIRVPKAIVTDVMDAQDRKLLIPTKSRSCGTRRRLQSTK